MTTISEGNETLFHHVVLVAVLQAVAVFLGNKIFMIPLKDLLPLFDLSPVSTLIVERKTDLILWANKKFCSLFNTTYEQIVGTSSVELINYNNLEDYYKIIGARKNNTYYTYEIEFRFNEIEFWGEVRVQNVEDKQIATIVNVTERVLAKKKLQETYQKIEEIQHNFLPDRKLKFPKLSFDYYYKALSYASGDMFCIVPQKEICGFTIADMSGHNLTASYLMAKFITFIKSSANFRNIRKTIRDANSFLMQISETDDFSSIFVASFNPQKMVLNYLNAGHPNQLVVRKDGTFKKLRASVPLIGSFSEKIFNPILANEKIQQVRLREGDKIILFSDAFLDPETSKEEFLLKLCRENTHLNCTELKDFILKNWLQSAGLEAFDDDATLLILEVKND